MRNCIISILKKECPILQLRVYESYFHWYLQKMSTMPNMGICGNRYIVNFTHMQWKHFHKFSWPESGSWSILWSCLYSSFGEEIACTWTTKLVTFNYRWFLVSFSTVMMKYCTLIETRMLQCLMWRELTPDRNWDALYKTCWQRWRKKVGSSSTPESNWILLHYYIFARVR